MKWLECRIPPLALCLVVLLLQLLIHRWMPFDRLPWAWMPFLGVALGLCGLTVMFSAAWQFRRHQTTLDPRDPARSARVVSEGVFGFSRNPMYLGMAGMIAGEGLALHSLMGIWLAALFVLYINRWQIIPEERALSALFGEEYTRYCQRVRRWL